MSRECLFIVLIHMIVFPLSCAFERNNPLDEGGPNFIPPKITIDEQASSVKDKDTLHSDSITITLIGNRDESVFNIILDTNVLVEWQPQGTFRKGGLSDGDHILTINSMYDGGEMIVSDTVQFYVLTKGFKPEFEDTVDTTIESFGGKLVTFIAPADGATPLLYSWLKNDSLLPGRNNDSLTLNSFSIQDTGSYKCIVSNEYGKDVSRIFILKFRPSTGGIKGIITDTAEKILKGATVTLTPSGKQATTKSDGKFEFNALSENTYTLKITLAGYTDKTVDDIEVNDSGIVELKEIELSWIDTTTYKIVYNGNGNDSGEVPVDPVKYKPNNKIIIIGNTGNLTKKGYSFLRWNTKKDGSGESYSAEDSLTIIDNTTLYAQWKIMQYTLSFNGNNSTSGSVPDVKEYGYNEKVTVPDSDFLKRAGYSFNGWNTKQNGKGKTYFAQDTLMIPDENVVLYAQWKAMTMYKVTYNSNEADSGTVPVDNDSYYEGKEVTVAGNPGGLFREGYSFAGWYLKIEGSDESYNAGSKFIMPASAVTFYAKWSTNPTYSIIYHGNTNTGGEVPPTVESDSGETVTIADSGSLIKTGYTFVEWNTKEDGSGNAYNTGTNIKMGAVNINLYAQWIKAQYTVTYHGNENTGGSVPPETRYFYGTDVNITSGLNLEKTGYAFFSWNTESNGTGVDYTSGSIIKNIDHNVDLYARWTINKYQVSYNGNNSTSGDVPVKATYDFGAVITVVAKGNLEKTGHTFIGWNTESDGSGESYGSGDEFTLGGEDVILYAQWKAHKYTVIFNTLGGNEIVPVTVNYGETISNPEKPVKTSYVFMKWCNDSSCNNEWKVSEDIVTGDDTLYAKWVIMDVDGNIYTEVKIGDQVWMVENLKTTRYNDSSLIPYVTTAEAWGNLYTCEENPCRCYPGYCWYDNDSITNHIYGALYNWGVIQTNLLAPVGWHVPTESEIMTLVNLIGGADIAGGKMKETGTINWNPPNEGATDSVGFKALPAGFRNSDGIFENIKNAGSWWTTEQITASTKVGFSITKDDFNLDIGWRGSTSGFSVRCLRNW